MFLEIESAAVAVDDVAVAIFLGHLVAAIALRHLVRVLIGLVVAEAAEKHRGVGASSGREVRVRGRVTGIE